MEASSAIELAKHTLLAGGIVLAVGIVTGFVARKIKVADVALFLLVGNGDRSEMLGLVDISLDGPKLVLQNRRCDNLCSLRDY